MADFYDDYEKIVLATNPYATWVNTPANLDAFYAALIKYYDEHKMPLWLIILIAPHARKILL
jgi:hypothetical protein